MKKIKRGRGRLKELCRLLTVNIKYLLIVTAGFVLFCICSLYMDGNDKFSGNYVKRPGVGEYDAEMEVVVEGLTDDAQRIELPISKRMYSDEEADEALAKGIEELVVIMQADNPSLQNVATGLNLVSELEELGLTVKWNLGESEIIDILGNVDNENLTENVDIEIEAILSDGKHSKNYIIPVRVVPRAYSESDRLLQRFLEFIKRIDKSEIQHDGYALPDSFEGRQII